MTWTILHWYVFYWLGYPVGVYLNVKILMSDGQLTLGEVFGAMIFALLYPAFFLVIIIAKSDDIVLWKSKP